MQIYNLAYIFDRWLLNCIYVLKGQINMANANPKIENLEHGRGKRSKLDHQTVAMRMSEQTKATLEEISLQFDCIYGGKAWIAGLLNKVAEGELVIIPAEALEAFQDAIDIVDARAAIAEAQVKGTKSWHQVKSELGL